VEICTVWSLSDAHKCPQQSHRPWAHGRTRGLLRIGGHSNKTGERAGIPFFMGPEKANGVEAVTSNFVNGVSVQAFKSCASVYSGHVTLSNYMPVNEPGPKHEDELDERPVRYPRCQSTEVIFVGLIAQPSARTYDGQLFSPIRVDLRFMWSPVER
jgi:hypothetical protein